MSKKTKAKTGAKKPKGGNQPKNTAQAKDQKKGK